MSAVLHEAGPPQPYKRESERRKRALVQLGGYCRRSALPLINLAYLLVRDRPL
jgi:hypothetical protein